MNAIEADATLPGAAGIAPAAAAAVVVTAPRRRRDPDKRGKAIFSVFGAMGAAHGGCDAYDASGLARQFPPGRHQRRRV